MVLMVVVKEVRVLCDGLELQLDAVRWRHFRSVALNIDATFTSCSMYKTS